MLILQHPQYKHDLGQVFVDTFNLVNQKFTQKAKEEVKIEFFSSIHCLS